MRLTTKMRRLPLVIVTSIVILGVSLGTVQLVSVKGDPGRSETLARAGTPPTQVQELVLDDSNLLDGSKEPDKIPDEAALGIVLRVVFDLRTKGKDESLRAYLEHIGFLIPGGKKKHRDKQVEALIKVATQYNEQVSRLDREAKVLIGPRSTLKAAARQAKLESLQREKTALKAKVADSLDVSLGTESSNRFRAEIASRVKPLIKIHQPPQGR